MNQAEETIFTSLRSNSLDIIFTRPYLSPREMYGSLASAGASEIPPGLCLLAAVTRRDGYNVEVIDPVAERLDNESLAKKILKKRPRYVGISSVTASIYKAEALARSIKEAAPDIKTLIGGPHLTGAPIETMERFPTLDIAVLGEGDITIIELLNVLTEGNDLSKVHGIAYREGNSLRLTAPREFIKNLDELPFPAWDMLPDISTHYTSPAWSLQKGASGIVILTRGCSHRCIYCDRSAFGGAIRGHSAIYAFEMIKELYYKYDIRQIRIMDDNFMLLKKRLVELCELIIKENLNIEWTCLARADSVTSELLGIMRSAGCWQIVFGVESGSQEIHDLEKKRVGLEVIENAVKLSRRAGIKTAASTMICHPKETKATIRSTIKFCTKVPFDDFKMVYLTPFPGTELYHTAELYGSFNKDWKAMRHYIEPCFIPFGLRREELIRYRRIAYLRFYLRPQIIIRHIKILTSIKQLVPLLNGFISVLKLCLGI